MPTTRKREPESALSLVERAVTAMTKRLETGDHPFSEAECRLFVALIQVQNSRNLMSDHDLLDDWERRFQQIEGWIRGRQTDAAIQAAARGRRRGPGIDPAGFPLDGQGQR